MIYRFNTKSTPTMLEVGGKAKALIELTKAGFAVPEGFVLPVEFFQPWMEEVRASAGWKQFVKSPTKECCDELKLIAAQMSFNAVQKEEFYEVLEVLSIESTFAVRSSAPEEDMETASFAGQYATVLGVDNNGLEKAVARVFASMLDIGVVEYKRRCKLSTNNPAMAVIVERQISADVAGVAFSANPQNGKEDEVMLNANLGLGETVVSGRVTPDLYILKDRKIIQKKIAHKNVALYLKKDGLTEERKIKYPEAESLYKKEAIWIYKLAKKVEDYYRKPMDIEWAIEGSKLYLLQARPISVAAIPFRWNVGPMPKGTMLARGGIVESMPEPLLPLYADYSRKHVVSTLTKLMERLIGADAKKIFDNMSFPIINGYGYYKYRLKLSLYWLMLKKVKSFITLFKNQPTWIEEEELPKIKARLAQLQALELEKVSSTELFEMSHELTETICTYYTYCQIYLAQAYTNEGLFIRFYDKKIRPKVGLSSHVFMLGEEMAPIIADKALYRLAEKLRRDEQLKEFVLNNSTDQLRDFLEKNEGARHPFAIQFNEYLSTYCNMIYDLDFSKATPLDDPRPIIKTLKVYMEEKGESPFRRQQQALAGREEAEKLVKDGVSATLYRRFKKKLKAARLFAPNRENGLANLGICQPFLRKVLLELGRRGAAEGAIERSEDIFWMKEDELTQFISGRVPAALQELIPERKELWLKERALNPPIILPKNARIMGIKLDAWLPKRVEEQREDNRYEGIAVSSGRITGKARVILAPEEFGTMEQGDILVTSMTTPAWTPLFAMAGGIVTDFGGPLSHSSIVAREYGIPAVLGTGGLSKIIKTGQTITVDADKGLVIVEDAWHPGEKKSSVDAA